MARPNPVPPILRRELLSMRWNFENNFGISSAGIPMPSSLIDTRRLLKLFFMQMVTLPPCGENLMALPIRFISTCARRSLSPSTITLEASSTKITECIDCVRNFSAVSMTNSFIDSFSIRYTWSPDSIRCRSRKSLIKLVNRFASL